MAVDILVNRIAVSGSLRLLVAVCCYRSLVFPIQSMYRYRN